MISPIGENSAQITLQSTHSHAIIEGSMRAIPAAAATKPVTAVATTMMVQVSCGFALANSVILLTIGTITSYNFCMIGLSQSHTVAHIVFEAALALATDPAYESLIVAASFIWNLVSCIIPLNSA